jgi:hypothetical protein
VTEVVVDNGLEEQRRASGTRVSIGELTERKQGLAKLTILGHESSCDT